MEFIRLYSDTVYALSDISNWYIDISETGINTMSFDIDTKHQLYNKISEEIILEYNNLYYKVKTINERTSSNLSTITAELDVDDLRQTAYLSYKVETKSFEQICNDVQYGILNNTGWRVDNISTVTGKRSIDLQNCTALDVLQYCCNTTVFNRKFKFDNKNKVITPINISEKQPTGAYFTDELNLSDMNFKGTSEGLITRLYAYGKDINITKYAGHEYIENHDYTDKVISAVWHDERYTDEYNLYVDAVEKLKQMSKPARSYSCKVLNLSAVNEKYDFLGVDLYDIVTLIDRNRNTKENHQVVNIRKYPFNPEQDIITLSSTSTTITNKLNKLVADFNDQKIINKSKWNEITRDISQNTANIGELYQQGEDSRVYFSNLISQTAQETIEQIHYSETAGTENLILHPTKFEDTANWTKSGSAWTLDTEDNYLKIIRLDTDVATRCYVTGELSKTVILSKLQNNYISVYLRAKASEPCRIYLCSGTTVIFPDAVKTSNMITKSGDIYYMVTQPDTWVDIYAQIQNDNTFIDKTIYNFGLYFSSDITSGNAPKGLNVWLDYIQVTNTPYYEDRITTIEKTADGILTEVSRKASSTDFELYKTEVNQKFDSISLTASNQSASSNLTLAVDGVEISSAEIKLTGMVTFSHLSTSGSSRICGDNITTGTISSVNGKCKINLLSLTVDFETTYSGGYTGKFQLSPAGLYFTDEDGVIQGSFFPTPSQNRTYLLAHRLSIAGTTNTDKTVETSFEAEYGSNGVPTGNLRLVGGSTNEYFKIQNIGVLSVNGINFDCRNNDVVISAPVKVQGITVDGVTFRTRYIQSEGIYVLASDAI